VISCSNGNPSVNAVADPNSTCACDVQTC